MSTTLLLGLALVVGAPAKEAPKKDEPTIVGEWFIESGISGGMPRPKPDKPKKFEFTKEGGLIVHEGEKPEMGKFTVDFKKKPAELDLIPPPTVKSPTVLAICKLEGDTLTICADREGGKRPTDFTSTEENKQMLIVLKRKKAE